VTVTLNVPVVARLPTVNVKVLPEVVAGFGLKDAVTLPGNPEADSLTLPAKPFNDVMVIGVLPCVPRATFTGEAERVKLGPAVMVRESGVPLLRLPHVPVTVTVNVPIVTLEPTANVSVLLPVVLTGFKDAVTPLGRPETDRLTVPLKRGD